MDDYVSETDSEYTSYWRDWVSPPAFPRADSRAWQLTGAT